MAVYSGPMKSQDLTLVLGSTGKTGTRVAANLVDRGIRVRRAARSGADVTFDWTQRASPPHSTALVGSICWHRSCASISPMTSQHFSMKQRRQEFST